MGATTTNIDATYQGIVQKDYTEGKSWDWVTSVRNAATGDSATTYTTNVLDDDAVYAYYFFNSKTSQYVGGCTRTFLFFDVSSITNTYTVTSATLKVLGYSVDEDGVIPVKATAWGSNGSTSTLGTGDYDAVTFATTYASAIASWNTSSYNDFTLNATAISDINTNGYINVALLNSSYDQPGSNPSGDFKNGIEFLDGVSDIKIALTYEVATGYGNNINGVATADIAAVIGIDTADISLVNGV